MGWIVWLGLILLSEGVHTSPHMPPVEKNTVPTASVLVFKRSPFHIDGRSTEPAWQQVPTIGPLQMVEPYEGGSPTEPTEVHVAATPTALYIGIRCYDDEPSQIVSYTMQRDGDLRNEDHIRLVLDTFLDGRTGYVFAVNANGARYDALVIREGEGENPNWDGIWEAAATRDAEGWSVEIRIPIKTLRFRSDLHTWGFNLERRIQRRQEIDRWASPSRNFSVT